MIVDFKNFQTGDNFSKRRFDYLKAINAGEFEPPSRFEKLCLIASGDDRRSDVQAARRCVIKRINRMLLTN